MKNNHAIINNHKAGTTSQQNHYMTQEKHLRMQDIKALQNSLYSRLCTVG